MWFKTKARLDNKSNSNKQSAKGGNIKNSTIEVGSGNDATVAIILQEVLKIGHKQEQMHNAFCHYVQNNGVKPKVKAEVKAMLDL